LRDIPAPLQAHIEQEVMTLTRIISLKLNNGVILRLTTLDEDVIFNGERYLSELPLEFSAMEFFSDLSVDNAEITIGIDEDLVRTDDLKTGLFDECEFETSIINWDDPSMGAIVLKRGVTGDIEIEEGIKAKIQLKGLTYLLQKPIVESYSLTCRAALGSKRCGVVLNPLKIRRRRQKVKTFDWFLVPDPMYVGAITLGNPSFEGDSDLAPWTIPDSSNWSRADTLVPIDGTYYAQAGSGINGQSLNLYQDFEVDGDLALDAGVLADGGYAVDFSVLVAATSTVHKNVVVAFVEQFDDMGRTIARTQSEDTQPDFEVWSGIGATTVLLPNCDTVRVGVTVRIISGSAGFIAVDAAQAAVIDNVEAAWDGTVFRTTKLPVYPVDERFTLGNPSFDSTGDIGNTNAAAGIAGWNITEGFWRVSGSTDGLTPSQGARFLVGGNNGSGNPEQEATITQTRTLAMGGALAAEATADNITAGWYYAELQLAVTRGDAGSQPRVMLTFLNATNTVLKEVDTGWITDLTTAAWSPVTLSSVVPAGTRSIRVSLRGKSGSGSSILAAFDNVRLFFAPTAYEHPNDPEQGYLSSTDIAPSYTEKDYTRDGDAVIQAMPIRFNYGVVTGIDTRRSFVATGIDKSPNELYSGRITWISGANAGRISYIRIWKNDDKTLRMYDALPNDIEIGDKFIYANGCNKTIDTCADIFGNAHNFRGEPYLPGAEKILTFLTEVETTTT